MDLIAFKHQLALVVSKLANAVMTEVFTVAGNEQKPGNEEKMAALMDSLCSDVVEKILQMLQDATVDLEGNKAALPGQDSNPPLTAYNTSKPDRTPFSAQDGSVSMVTSAEATPPLIDVPDHEYAAPPIGRGRGKKRKKQHTISAAAIFKDAMISVTSPKHTHTDTHTLSLSHTLTDTHSLSHTLTDTLTDTHSLSHTLTDTDSLSHTDTLTDTHSLSHTLTDTHTDPHTDTHTLSLSHTLTDTHSISHTDTLTDTHTLLQCPKCPQLFPNTDRLCEHQLKAHLRCSVCGAVFNGLQKLRDHESREHGLLRYDCQYCSKRFNHKTHRDLHVKARHTGEKTCHCDVCGKGYSSISVLKTHRITHFAKSFVCDVCGKSFYHACHLTRHKVVHQAERPYHCAVCGRGFTQRANLHSHQLTHTGDRQLCSMCGKSYRCLKNHLISKHGHELPASELPASDIISCDTCDKKFPNQSQLRSHQRSHTGDKPFHCEVCGRGFRLKEMQRDHMSTHSGEKPFSCSECGKSFSLLSSFMRHRSIHSGETPHGCSLCGKHFRLHSFLKAHMQTKAHLKQAQQETDS